MEIFEFFESKYNDSWIKQIENCDWNAAKLLSKLLKNTREFSDVLGEGGRLYIMRDNSRLVSFATLTQRECIKDDSLFPWIGFVFTVPEYRGNRYSKMIIDYVCDIAQKQGYDKVYIATEHAGELYKKYGFSYRNTMIDVFGAENQVLYKEL